MQYITSATGSRPHEGSTVFNLLAATGALLALFVLLSSSMLRAQSATADILGTVTDSSGAVVPDAKVTASNVATGIAQSTKSSKSGEYLFAHLQIGTYKVTIEAKGFKTFVNPGLTVAVGDRARMDAKLEIGSQVETVEIEASAAPALKTDDSTMDTLITTTAVADLPLNGRNITNLVQLSAGVTEGASNAPGGGSWFSGHSDDLRQTSAFSANGQNDIYNNQMVDGMDNNERAIGTQVIKPSIDGIDQVVVMTNLYPAEYGRTEGGMMNVITKSGTNQFHGTAYEYVRNDKFDAAAYDCGVYCGAAPSSILPKGELRLNQFGGSLGGPIFKNKTFFFGDYEGFRIVSATTISYATVPDYADQQAVAGAAVGAVVTLDDGLAGTTAVPDPTFSATVTQLGKNLMALYPKPNSLTAIASDNNFSFTPKVTQFVNSLDARLDEHFSDKDLFFARYSWENTATAQPAGLPAETIGSNTFSNSAPSTITTQGIGVDWVHTFSANVLFEAKSGWTRFWNYGGPENGLNAATELGFAACPAIPATASSPAFCVNSPYGGANAGLPGMGPNFYTAIGDGMFTPLQVIDNSFQYMGDLTWNRGNHSLKTGVAVIRRQLTRLQSPSARGQLNSGGTFTGDGLADMVEGIADNAAQQTTLNFPQYRSWEPSIYVQDDWRARPWLTLNLGLRYDIYTPYTDKHGSFSNFNTTLGILQSPKLVGIYAGSNTDDLATDYSDISPRVGFSASLHHQMVVRGGIGMSYFPNETGGGTVVSMSNPPFTWSKSFGNSHGNFYPVPSAMQLPAYQGQTCSGANTMACLMNMQVGVEEPYLSAATAEFPALEGGGNEIDGVANTLKAGRLVQYSIEIQKEFGANVIAIGYIGNQGRHLPEVPDINQAAYATPTAASLIAGCASDSLADFNLCQFAQGPSPYYSTDAAYAISPTYANTAATIELDGQDLYNDPIYATSAIATSNYNAMDISFTRRLSRSLATNANYTWAHAMDNGSPQGEGGSRPVECVRAGCLLDLGNGSTKTLTGFQQYDHGDSDIDVKSRFAGTINYALPFAKNSSGYLSYVAKGWNVNAAGVYQTSLPANVGEPGGGPVIANVSGIAGWRGGDAPNQVATTAPHTHAEWFDPADYVPQTPGTLGNVQRNSIRGPHARHLDISIAKDFPLPENMKLQFRADAFNATNTTNFGLPGATRQVQGYSEITSTATGYNPRLMQLALRLSF